MQNIVKKYVKKLELCKNKPRITYRFTVTDIFLLLASIITYFAPVADPGKVKINYGSSILNSK